MYFVNQSFPSNIEEDMKQSTTNYRVFRSNHKKMFKWADTEAAELKIYSETKNFISQLKPPKIPLKYWDPECY
jgi:hypothetical protein